MSKHIDLGRLTDALKAVRGLQFAVLFGSAKDGELPREDSDVDVAVSLDHEPRLEEFAQIVGLIQDAVGSDRVDLVVLRPTGHYTLHREVLKGRLLVCHDPEAYASFFSLTDRRARDEEARIVRAWNLRHELAQS